MSDLIDRQSVLKAIDEYERLSMVSQTVRNMTSLREIVQWLPAVQTCDDAVSRQQAIDALDGEVTVTGRANAEAVLGYANLVTDRIKRLPPVQPERPKGKWIYGEDEYGIDGYHCDKCGFFVPWDYVHKFINYIEDYNFCPNCGADMRGE